MECKSLAQLPPDLQGNMTPNSRAAEEKWERRSGSSALDLLDAWFDICNWRISSLGRVI